MGFVMICVTVKNKKTGVQKTTKETIYTRSKGFKGIESLPASG